MCRTYPMQDKNYVKHIDTNEEENPQSEHCEQDYTRPFFLRKEEGIKSTVKSLKTNKKKYTTSTTRTQNTFNHYGSCSPQTLT